MKQLSGEKKLYVMDLFCGTNPDSRMAVRFVMEVAWQAHFVKNMFITPTEEELKNFEPDFVIYNASKAKVENYKELGLNSETAVLFNLTSKEQVILNTWYGGEMKKGMFSMMKRTAMRVSLLVPQNTSMTYSFLLDSCSMARRLHSVQASWEAGLLSLANSLEVHHTVSLEVSSITMNLSLGERPV